MMKRYNCNIRIMSAMLIAGAAFAACSIDNNITSKVEQSTYNNEKVYTLRINAFKGDDTQTRALDLSGTTLTASWESGDEITVTKGNTTIGTLTASKANGNSADFSGTLTGEIVADDILTLTYHPVTDAYAGQNGKLSTIASTYDCAVATLTVKEVDTTSGEIIVNESFASFESQQAIVKFTLKDGDNNLLSPTVIKATLSIGTTVIVSYNFNIASDTYDADENGGAGILFIALPQLPSANAEDASTAIMTIEATVGSETYTAKKVGYTIVNGKYYGNTMTMTRVIKIGDFLNKDGSVTPTKQTSGDKESYAVIAYLGNVPNYFDNFLAIALDNAVNTGIKYWDDAMADVDTYVSNHCITKDGTIYNINNSPTYYDVVNSDIDIASNTRTTGTLKGWRLPSVTDLRYIFQGLCSGPSATSPVGINYDDYGDGSALVNAINSACGNETFTPCWTSSLSYGSNGGIMWAHTTVRGSHFSGYYKVSNRFAMRLVFAY